VSALQRTYRIQGLGLDKLLQQLKESGITVYRIRRLDLRTMVVSCDYTHCKAFEDTVSRCGFSFNELAPTGAYRQLLLLKSHRMLMIIALIMALALSLSLQLVWHIDIIHGGIYTGEVKSFLHENGIHPGMPRTALKLNDLRDALTLRLPHAAWIRVEYKGLSLCIEIIHGIPSPAIENAGPCGDLIAASDGVIKDIHVYAGTAAVGHGDTVKKGDTLIYGHEKRTGDSIVSVRARGKIVTSVFAQETAAVSSKGYKSTRTGQSTERTVIVLPFARFSFTGDPDYLTSERETKRLPLTNLFLPVWLEKETVYEVLLSETPVDEATLKAEAAHLAMQKLTTKMHENDEIIDKWLDYSMIEGGNILATVTAVILTETVDFSPQTPD